jgi:4-carboxymuconolactone decarboxylase
MSHESSSPSHDRLPMPRAEEMNPAQRAAADALIAGPRKGVYGPFLPLLRSPALLDHVAQLGEYLRFKSVLDARVRELAICIVARHLTNQFEWVMHAPLARKAGVADATIDAVRVGAAPKSLPDDEDAAFNFTQELLRTHGVSEPAYRTALTQFGEQGVVELATLAGYFTMVSLLMNAAHTPPASDVRDAQLPRFPL